MKKNISKKIIIIYNYYKKIKWKKNIILLKNLMEKYLQ